MSIITLLLDGNDESLALSAAQWMCAFHKGASAVVEGPRVILGSHELTEVELRRIWNAALLNERAHAENEGKRRQVLEQLSR